MDLSPFMSPADAGRAQRTLLRLRGHRLERLVLTGGLAIELHCARLGVSTGQRPLNDIDFLVDRFDDIPLTLASDLLFRHVHPHDPPAKTLMQCVDPETAVRVDIFRACGDTIARSVTMELCGHPLRIVSIEDLTARTARLCMDLARGEPLPAKHARDFLRLLPLVGRDETEPAWQDHRKPSHPASFSAAARVIQEAIATRPELQIAPVYSQDVFASCSRCEPTEGFPLADAAQVLALLGYC